MKRFVLLTVVVFWSVFSIADEGMWIPLLLKDYNYETMKARGCRLTSEEIFSINNTSLKDAIVIFGGGCTGELVSDEGLLITNHHCGYGSIQQHSSVEKDYLTHGFWAMSREEELSNPGLSVTFLVSMSDVTNQVLKGVTDTISEPERQTIIDQNIAKIVEDAIAGTHFEAIVKPFFNGNEYYLYVNEVFKDVRLVGAPPSAIGKFGGDTDNWMWPRHTGDFSLFRIYADSENRPADYSPDNVPYKPKKYLPVSLKGVEKGDFTFVYGYPGTTTEYLPSYAVRFIKEVENPHQIALRAKRLEIMDKYMSKSDKVRIQYASKYASVANYWKKWIGENKGLTKLDAIAKKEALEKRFQNWADADPDRKAAYGNILGQYEELYKKVEPFKLALDYIYEGAYAIDLIKLARNMRNLTDAALSDPEVLENEKKKLESVIKSHFKNYNIGIDKEVMAYCLSQFSSNIPEKYQPQIFQEVKDKFKGDFQAYTDFVFEKSILASEERALNFVASLNQKSMAKFIKDPGWQLFGSINNTHASLYYSSRVAENSIERLDRIYIKALREMDSDKIFYPDANFTLRIAFGQVDDYFPMDGVRYDEYTTLEGIIEKDNPEIYDYDVPDKLKELYLNKNYGQYGVNDTMKVCFIASNHTTGGNSGSPVINADGELIGVNFDRNWEGTMSDIMYNPDQCRNIVLDIRYALFIIDKFAGAGHLVEEMTLIK